MGSSEKIKRAVAGYFNDPKGTGSQLGTTMTGTGPTVSQVSTDELQKLKDKLEQEIKARKELEKLSKQIEITITPEGLCIELIEGMNGTFYEIGSPKLSSNGQELLALLASELKTLPNSLLIEGHTDSTPYSDDNGYSDWDLSGDRANSARRLLQHDGVRTDQVTQVRGYADQMLRVKNNPTDPSNRRISILVKTTTRPCRLSPRPRSWTELRRCQGLQSSPLLLRTKPIRRSLRPPCILPPTRQLRLQLNHGRLLSLRRQRRQQT